MDDPVDIGRKMLEQGNMLNDKNTNEEATGINTVMMNSYENLHTEQSARVIGSKINTFNRNSLNEDSQNNSRENSKEKSQQHLSVSKSPLK